MLPLWAWKWRKKTLLEDEMARMETQRLLGQRLNTTTHALTSHSSDNGCVPKPSDHPIQDSISERNSESCALCETTATN